MARITVEDCLTQENNRFALVQLAAKRTKQILQGSKILSTEAKANKAVVSSLREIAAGKVRFMTAEEIKIAQIEEEKEAAQKAREALEKLTSGINGHSEKAAPVVPDVLLEAVAEKAAEQAAEIAAEEIAGDDDSGEDGDEDGDIPDLGDEE